jgi:fibronectin type III domain protein
MRSEEFHVISERSEMRSAEFNTGSGGSYMRSEEFNTSRVAFNSQLLPKLSINPKSAREENLMARVRLNLGKLSVTDKIAKGRQIVSAMTNNTSFPNPTPPLADVTGALDDLEKAFASVQSARSEVSTRAVTQDNQEDRVDQLLRQLAGYVESVAGKDDTLITSAGMETKATASAATAPTIPQAFSATAGEHEGEIILSWKPVPNARSYTIEFNLDPATTTSWAHLTIATSASKVITNLKSGTRYWFRVAAVGAAGQSGWSEQATKIVP